MKSLNEENERMKKLMGFTYEDNSHNNLSEEFITESLNEQKKNKGGGFSIGRKGINRMGRTGGYVDFSYDIDPIKLNIDWDREKGEELETEEDLLNKMDKELSKDKGYNSLTAEQKRMIATGFWGGVKKIVSDNLKDVVDKKQRRNLKKFFKKSNRWDFDIFKVKGLEKCTSKENCKSGKFQKASSISLTTTNYSDPKIPKNKSSEIEANAKLQMNEVIANNSSVDVITKQNVTQTLQQNPLISENNLNPFIIKDSGKGEGDHLEVIVPYQKYTVKYKKISDDEQYLQTIDLDELDTGKLPVNFAPLKYEIKSKDASTVRNSIINKLRSYPVPTDIKLKGEYKTVGDLVDAGIGKINISTINLIGAASNVYGGKKLEPTHDINGNPIPGGRTVKDIQNDPNSTDNDKKNIKLGGQRLKSMNDLVISLIKSVPWLMGNKQTSMIPSLKIIDTGGKADEAGQYTQVILDGVIQVIEDKVKEGEGVLGGKFELKRIVLDFEGKPKSDFLMNLTGGIKARLDGGPSKDSRYMKKGPGGTLRQRSTKHMNKKKWTDGSSWTRRRG